jgi:uncharacterized protein (DUF4415 family)
LIDPDDAPELTDAFFERADIYQGTRLVRRGRPKVGAPKQQVTLRLDAAVVEGLRATGPGWQTRANEALRTFLDKSRITPPGPGRSAAWAEPDLPGRPGGVMLHRTLRRPRICNGVPDPILGCGA